MTNPSVLTVTTNARLLARVLGDVAGEQIPFATARALTDVAFVVQRAEKSEMARAFTLRNRFSQGGVQVNPAEKGDWPNMRAEVGIEERRSYLIDHVTGGRRDGGRHGRAILEQEALRSKSGRVPAGKRPGALIDRAMRAKARRDAGRASGEDKRLPFLIYSSKWKNEVLVQRTGADRYPLQIVYAFKRGVSIRREYPFDLIAGRHVQSEYMRAFDRRLRQAIASGKSKAERRGSDSRGVGIDSGR
ncbi:MAG TPA: hypothetical protein VGE09_11325 [Pseudoxanthomonas sp.]